MPCSTAGEVMHAVARRITQQQQAILRARHHTFRVDDKAVHWACCHPPVNHAVEALQLSQGHH